VLVWGEGCGVVGDGVVVLVLGCGCDGDGGSGVDVVNSTIIPDKFPDLCGKSFV
jgi:hypothetical protein